MSRQDKREERAALEAERRWSEDGPYLEKLAAELARKDAEIQRLRQALEAVGHLLWDGKNDDARKAVHEALSGLEKP